VKGEEETTFAWAAILVFLIAIIVGIYFVTPEFREALGIGVPPPPEKIEILINQWIGEPKENIERISLAEPFDLKYLKEKILIEERTAKMSSSIFKPSSIILQAGADEILELEPISSTGVIEVQIGDQIMSLTARKEIVGPKIVKVICKVSGFRLAASCQLIYKRYRVREIGIKTKERVSFSLENAYGSGVVSISGIGRCDLIIYLNNRKIWEGNILGSNTIPVENLQLGNNVLELKAKPGADCSIREILITAYGKTTPRSVERKFDKLAGDFRVFLDVEKTEGDPIITVTILGKEKVSFRYNLTSPASPPVREDVLLRKGNVIKIEVKNGRILLDKIRLSVI